MPNAITATARKLAILVYRPLSSEITYADPGAAADDRRRRLAALRNLRKRAQFLGFALVNQTTVELLEEGASWEPANRSAISPGGRRGP